jgi:hypothetical protein
MIWKLFVQNSLLISLFLENLRQAEIGISLSDAAISLG